jgi:hypothetical protein
VSCIGWKDPVSSQRTRELLDWQPQRPGLIADINPPSYFEIKADGAT